ncbi:hypothetical protein QQ045_000655 [Rhodiola kirilowii]
MNKKTLTRTTKETRNCTKFQNNHRHRAYGHHSKVVPTKTAVNKKQAPRPPEKPKALPSSAPYPHNQTPKPTPPAATPTQHHRPPSQNTSSDSRTETTIIPSTVIAGTKTSEAQHERLTGDKDKDSAWQEGGSEGEELAGSKGEATGDR